MVTASYVSLGYYIEELLVNGVQHVIIRRATQRQESLELHRLVNLHYPGNNRYAIKMEPK